MEVGASTVAVRSWARKLSKFRARLDEEDIRQEMLVCVWETLQKYPQVTPGSCEWQSLLSTVVARRMVDLVRYHTESCRDVAREVVSASACEPPAPATSPDEEEEAEVTLYQQIQERCTGVLGSLLDFLRSGISSTADLSRCLGLSRAVVVRRRARLQEITRLVLQDRR